MKLRKATAGGPAAGSGPVRGRPGSFSVPRASTSGRTATPMGSPSARTWKGGTAWVLEEDGQVVATACLGLGREPTYDTIYQGAWGSEAPEYAFLHRIAVSGACKGKGVPSCSSKSWSARPGSGACPACGGTPTGRTRSCSGSWRKTACPAGASSTWRTGESAWPLRSCCNILRGRKQRARWPLLLSCVGGYFSRTYFWGELFESFFMSLISNMSRLSKKGVSLEKPKLRTSKSV